MKIEKVRAWVFRYDPEKDSKPRYVLYEVPCEREMRILDVLTYIYENIDSSLAFRYSCLKQRCGSCAVTVNGKGALACLEPVQPEMVIEPLSNFPVIRDLVIDRSVMDGKIAKVYPFARIKEPDQIPERLNPAQFEQIKEIDWCLWCYACVATCPVFEELWNEYSGPACMVGIAKFALDPRDDVDRIVQAFKDGLYDCTTCGQCKEVCPHDIAVPEIVIEKLRTLAVKKEVGPLSPHRLFSEKIVETGRAIDKTQKPFLEEFPEVIKGESPQMRVGYFTGCLVDFRLQHVGKALLNILTENNVEVIIPREQICCGSPLLRTGQVDVVKEHLVRKNVETFERIGVDLVLVSCAGCARTLRTDYPKLCTEVLERPPNFKVLHTTEFLGNLLKLNNRHMKPVKLRVTYHDPCHLRRGLGIIEEPRSIIRSIPGLKFVEMEKPDRCCGAGGGVRAGRRELSYLIGDKKAGIVRKTRANAVVTACPFCELQLSDVLRDSNMKVLDLVELLDRAYSSNS